MKQFYDKVKKCAFILMIVLCMAVAAQQTAVPVYAYTQEEKDAAKAWLSAHGYSPDMGGAQAAYADYMNGKFGAIPGLPEPNVKPQEPAPPAEEPADTSQPDEEKDNKKDKKPNKDSQKDSEKDNAADGNTGGDAVTPPTTGETPEDTQTEKPEQTDSQDTDKAAEDLEELVESVDLPDGLSELTLPTPSQQEFADMIDVFVESFSEDDQEEINKAKERLERQKQERAAAEKEAESAAQPEHAPQKNVIMILCGVLALAIIGLGILIVKKKSKQ